MIVFQRVCKDDRLRASPRVVLDNASLFLPEARSLGILGAPGAGKTALLRLLAGVERPNSGRIRRSGRRISLPLGCRRTLHPALSGRDNAAFLARLFGADARQAVAYAEAFAELGDRFDQPVGTYSDPMRDRLAVGACLAIPFDVFLVDETVSAGDAAFRARCQQAFQERTQQAEVIVASADERTIRDCCDAAAVLHDGRLDLFDDLDDAIALHRRIRRDRVESLPKAA